MRQIEIILKFGLRQVKTQTSWMLGCMKQKILNMSEHGKFRKSPMNYSCLLLVGIIATLNIKWW